MCVVVRTLVGLFVLYQIQVAQSTATLEIKLVQYNNTASRDNHGDPCEFFKIQGDCSHYFKLCLIDKPEHETPSSGFNPDACHCDLFYNTTATFFTFSQYNLTMDEIIEWAYNWSQRLADEVRERIHDNITGIIDPDTTRQPDRYGFGNDNRTDMVNEFINSDILTLELEWDGSFLLYIDVFEFDVAGFSTKVDVIQHLFTFTPDYYESVSEWTSITLYGDRDVLPSSLELQIRAYCNDDYEGPNCDCQSESLVCELTEHEEHYYCNKTVGIVCLSGWTDPATNCTTSIDDCVNNTCEHGGTCLDHHRNFTCVCSPGYTGHHCETDINQCDSNPCHHGARCTDGPNQFTCSCPPGFVGPTCATPSCGGTSDVKCNKGQCVSGVCKCLPGYGDPLCNTKLCDVIICRNGGLCQDGVCTCAIGFTGSRCEFELCDMIQFNSTMPCLNGGTCLWKTGECNCLLDFTGRHCETWLESCTARCENGGTCLRGRCVCHKGYWGPLCEQSTEGDYTIHVILLVCCTTVTLAAIVTAFTAVDWTYGKHGARGRSDTESQTLTSAIETEEIVLEHTGTPPGEISC